MARRLMLSIVVSAAIGAAFASAASAATPIRLVLDQGYAFSILGHSCGGIQEKVYATGFGSNGYPTGDVHLSTSCGGSGRGGGYKTTTYTAWATTSWTWFGETRSAALLQGAAQENEKFSATDEHGDHLYNSGTAAYLETGTPPLQAPAAPTGVSPYIGLYEAGTTEYLRMTVTWTPAPETAGLLKYSTITATPVNSPAPVLTASANGAWSIAYLGPIEPNTTYRVTVTNTDSEGTSETGGPIEIKSPNSDGEAVKEHKNESCAQNTGKITLSPGLNETPAVQTMTVKGELKECEGPLGPEGATYTAKLKTTEAVTCSVLAGATLEGTAAVSLAVKWLPAEEGSSKGSLVMPLSEAPLAGVTGTLSGGPFAAATNFKSSSVFESFTGGSTCGVPQGKKGVVKIVKAGTFSTSEVEFG